MFWKDSATWQISKKESQQSLEIDGKLESQQDTPHEFNRKKKMLWSPAEVNIVQTEKWERSSLG